MVNTIIVFNVKMSPLVSRTCGSNRPTRCKCGTNLTPFGGLLICRNRYYHYTCSVEAEIGRMLVIKATGLFFTHSVADCVRFSEDACVVPCKVSN